MVDGLAGQSLDPVTSNALKRESVSAPIETELNVLVQIAKVYKRKLLAAHERSVTVSIVRRGVAREEGGGGIQGFPPRSFPVSIIRANALRNLSLTKPLLVDLIPPYSPPPPSPLSPPPPSSPPSHPSHFFFLLFSCIQ